MRSCQQTLQSATCCCWTPSWPLATLLPVPFRCFPGLSLPLGGGNRSSPAMHEQAGPLCLCCKVVADCTSSLGLHVSDRCFTRPLVQNGPP